MPTNTRITISISPARSISIFVSLVFLFPEASSCSKLVTPLVRRLIAKIVRKVAENAISEILKLSGFIVLSSLIRYSFYRLLCVIEVIKIQYSKLL